MCARLTARGRVPAPGDFRVGGGFLICVYRRASKKEVIIRFSAEGFGSD